MASKYDRRDKEVMAIFAAPALALMIWHFLSKSDTPPLLLNCYVLAATPVYLLVGQYPPFGSRWFWRAMTPIFLMIVAAVYAQVQVTAYFRSIEVTLPARMAFGFASVFAVLEGWHGALSI
jgi:hypothetical protein